MRPRRFSFFFSSRRSLSPCSFSRSRPNASSTHALSPPKTPIPKTPTNKKASLVEPQAPSKLPSPAAAALCASVSAKHLPLILLADPGLAARRAVWIGLDLGAAEVIEKPPAESKLRTVWQHAVRRAAAFAPAAPGPAALPSLVLLPPSSSAAAMRRRSISGALGGGGCSSGNSLSNGGNGLVPGSGETSRDSLEFDSCALATATSSRSAASAQAQAAAAQAAAAAAAAAQARVAAATAARSAAVCRRANSMGSRPAPRKFVARSASAARIGGSRGSLDGATAAMHLHRAAASDQHLEQLLSNEALRRQIASMSPAPQPLAPPPPPMVLIPLGPGEAPCDADDAATSAVAAAMTAGLDITRSLTPAAQIIGADGSAATTPPGCVWGTPLLASTAADAAAAAASTAAAAAGAPHPHHAASQPSAAAPSYRHYPVDHNNGDGDCCLAPAPITSFEESSMLTSGSGGGGPSGGSGSGGLSPSESGGNGSGGSGGGGFYHESLRSPSSAFDVCYSAGDVRSRNNQDHHGHVPLVDLADALDDVSLSLALGLPALVPPAGKDDRDEEDGVVAKAVAAAAAAAAKGGASGGMLPPRGPSLFSSAEAAQAQAQAQAQGQGAPPPTSAPLGLSLKKSASLLDMINERLTSAVCGTPLAP